MKQYTVFWKRYTNSLKMATVLSLTWRFKTSKGIGFAKLGKMNFNSYHGNEEGRF